uniref:Mothers against decapentaplegic homolog n=1 Tax=Monopterus albus TaxID=43700 RepID=A0A3Q3JU21_MONAL
MFKSKRSGLVRRLWRSRLVTESDGHSGKLYRHEQRSVTHTEPAPGLTGEAGDLSESAGREEEEQLADHQGAMCVPEHGASGQDGDGRTITCCLFGEWDFSPQRPYWTTRKDGGGPCQCASRHAGLEDELASIAHAFLKRLKERSLDALANAVETKEGIPSECVMVPRTELQLGAHHISPQFLLCKLYRWSDLPLSAHLKALCHCQSFDALDSAKVCSNPYHYSRICGPGKDTNCGGAPHSAVFKLHYPNFMTNLMPYTQTYTGTSLGSSTSDGHRSHWCSVAYWEQRTRVGRLYPAHEPSLSIFYDLPQGTGLCLSQLHTNRNSHSSSVQQIRRKIGFGIVLSREPDGVWVYNRSQHPVFVHSPTLDPPTARGLSVKRVMPGFSLKVFDFERSSWMAGHGMKPESQEGPWDPHSVRISFAKGWGPCYSRQFITSCPCWLEVLLNNHR